MGSDANSCILSATSMASKSTRPYSVRTLVLLRPRSTQLMRSMTMLKSILTYSTVNHDFNALLPSLNSMKTTSKRTLLTKRLTSYPRAPSSLIGLGKTSAKSPSRLPLYPVRRMERRSKSTLYYRTLLTSNLLSRLKLATFNLKIKDAVFKRLKK